MRQHRTTLVSRSVAATSSVLLIIAAAVAPVPAASTLENPWGALLRNDVEAMYRILRDSHPGAVDGQNTWFRSWLNAGRKQALERAKTCNSFEGYLFGLRAYAIGFRDGHLGVSIPLWRGWRRWAGFLGGHRDGKLNVRVRADDNPELPPLGAEVVSCDGIAVAELMRRDLFPFVGNPELEREWDRFSPYLFVDEGNPWRAPPPRTCVFIDQPGATPRIRSLTWRRPPPDLGDKISVAAERVKLDFVIRKAGARGVWVGLPTFNAKVVATG